MPCRCWKRLCANDVDVPAGRAVYTAMLNSARRLRERPDRDPHGRARVPDHHRHHPGRARLRLDQPADWRARARRATRRDHGFERDRRDGPALARTAGARQPGRFHQRGVSVRQLAAGRAGHGDCARGADHLCGRAAGSCTCRPPRRCWCTTRWWRPAPAWGWPTPATTRSTRCAWRRASRAWGAEPSPEETPLEAGLGFAVAWQKPGGFIGREALLAQRAGGLRRMLVTFVLHDPAPVLWAPS